MKKFERFEHGHKTYRKKCQRNSEASRFMMGLFILFGGLALLLRSLDIQREFIDTYIFEWQVVLIAIGLSSVISNSNKGPGLIMLVLGTVFYLRDYYNFSFSIVFWQVMAAVILLLIGFAMLFMRRSRDKRTIDGEKTDLNPDIIEDIAILGGSERSMITDSFRGGKLMAFLGGSVFNLKGCSMAQGKNHLDVICVFGGFKMTVPEDWNIQIKTISIFGGISDKGQNTHQSQDVIYTNVLIIKGLLLFGGGEIKR